MKTSPPDQLPIHEYTSGVKEVDAKTGQIPRRSQRVFDVTLAFFAGLLLGAILAGK